MYTSTHCGPVQVGKTTAWAHTHEDECADDAVNAAKVIDPVQLRALVLAHSPKPACVCVCVCVCVFPCVRVCFCDSVRACVRASHRMHTLTDSDGEYVEQKMTRFCVRVGHVEYPFKRCIRQRRPWAQAHKRHHLIESGSVTRTCIATCTHKVCVSSLRLHTVKQGLERNKSGRRRYTFPIRCVA